MKKFSFTRKLKCRFALLFSLILLGQISFAQNFTVSGTVSEAVEKTTLPGVTVMEKGTENVTITDIDGNFTLSIASKDAVLEVRYIGYVTQEVAVNGSSSLNIVLEPKAEAIEEVVIVGYGTVKKNDLTGSIGSLNDETMTERSVTNPLQAIQGNVAGVNISNSTGRIGDEFNITIRGKNSMNEDSKPLYVVDGVPTDGIDFINPNDISRIDILKDASSTAIYGSRGSNGVIIVTTKSGETAKKGVNISIDSYYGVKKVARLPEMMDGAEWWAYHQSAYLATLNLANPMAITPTALANSVVGTKNSLLLERALANETFDWYDAVLQDGATANNYITISGQNGNGTSFNMGLGMQNESGNIANEFLDKYTFKTSVLHRASDKLSMGTNVSLAMTDQEQGSEYAMREAFRLAPLMNPYGFNNELYPTPGKLVDLTGKTVIDKTSTYNPLLEIANTTDRTKRWNLIANAFVEYKPISWLTFKSNFSAGYDDRKRGEAWGVQTNTGVQYGNQASAEINAVNNFNYTWDNQFNINYTLKENHSFNLMGLQSIYSSTTNGSSMISRNMPFETDFYNMGSGAQGSYAMTSYYTKQTLASFAMRLNYSYKGKYLVTLSNRYDGSSLLSDGNKWESFFSGALAWRITEEDFMKNQNIVSNLKLRLSYGYTGNNIIDPYSTLNKLDQQTYYEYNGTVAVGWLPASLSNNLLTWEKTSEFNIGLDFGFLNNRIFGSVDTYSKLSDGLLMAQQLPKETGWGTINANIGSVSNKGVELSLTSLNIYTEKLKWETTFIFSKNINKIVSLYGQTESDDVGNKWFIGEGVDVEYGYEFNGIWQASEKDLAASFGQKEGQVKVVDQNGDGVITADDDRIILGSATPDWTGSFSTKVSYANFDLSASVITNQGVFVYSRFHANFADTEDRGRQKLAGLSYYVPENGAGLPAQYSNEYPQGRNPGPYGKSSEYYKDASFVKVKNISLGYTFNNELLSKIKLNYLRVYFNVLDPFVFTEYEGYDPEWADASYEIGRVGSTTYQLGLNLKF